MKINTKNRKGKLEQTATIFSNDPQQPKTQISIVGSIKPYIMIEPHFRVTLKGFAGEDISQKVTITSAEQEPLKITEITSTIDDNITYELKTIEKGKSYGLSIRTRAGLKEPFGGKILVKTTSKKKPELEIFVTGRLLKEIQVAPQYIYFGIIDTSKAVTDPQSLTRTAEVSRVKGDDLTIEKTEPSSEWIMTQIEPQDKKHTIVITLDKDKLPKGEFKERIKIFTQYDNTPEVVLIIIEGKVI